MHQTIGTLNVHKIRGYFAAAYLTELAAPLDWSTKLIKSSSSGDSPKIPPKSQIPAIHVGAHDLLRGRKTVRTVMRGNDGVCLTDAKINLQTGEITQADYARLEMPRKPVAKAVLPDILPPWMLIAPPVRALTKYEQDKSRKKIWNTAKDYFQGYVFLDDALDAMPFIDNFLQGALNLDLGGNSRPLNANIVFSLVQHLDWFSATSVSDFLQCCVRHAQKIVQVLNVFLVAFEHELAKRPGIKPIQSEVRGAQ